MEDKAMTFDILYHDTYLIAINKPSGYFVHKTALDYQAKEIVLPLLRDQIGHRVYPVHRLDRKTHGVLLFALDTDTQRTMNAAFQEWRVLKEYLAIVRGYTVPEGSIDYDLTNDRNQLQHALTRYKTLAHSEINYQSHKDHATSRYSLVSLSPHTGRQHQLRKHMSHIFHPIVGDRPHGCNKQNRFFLQTFQMQDLMLFAKSIQFSHPITDQIIVIEGKISSEMLRVGHNIMGWDMGSL